MFDKKKYITRGLASEIPLFLQIFMWQCIDEMKGKKDYLQIFRLSVTDGNGQKVVHSQERPRYKKEYLFYLAFDEPVNAKIYCIDDGEHATMLLADEY